LYGYKRFQKTGEQRQADFINIVAWRATAEFVARYFHKGSMIAVTGTLQQNSYTDKEGNKRTSHEVIADNVNFCGSKSEDKPSEPASYSKDDSGDFEEISVGEDDLPF